MRAADFKEGDRVEFLLSSKHLGTPTSYMAGERGTVLGAYPPSPVNDDELLIGLDFKPGDPERRWVNVEPEIVRKLSILEVLAEAASD